MSRAPVPDQEVPALRALIVGLCVLLVMTPAVAAANGQQNAPRQAPKGEVCESELAHARAEARSEDQGGAQVPRRDPLLRDAPLAPQLGQARDRARAGRASSRDGDQGGELLPAAHPRSRRQEAGATSRARHAARCDLRACSGGTATRPSPSRGASPVTRRPRRTASTSASSRWASGRRAFAGHGDTAHEQAVAAHRYFVRTGRDWSPWSCRWAAS